MILFLYLFAHLFSIFSFMQNYTTIQEVNNFVIKNRAASYQGEIYIDNQMKMQRWKMEHDNVDIY
jgi:hypothetical protein